jgi:glycosyltransferase involved in cell wall biosynthesis
VDDVVSRRGGVVLVAQQLRRRVPGGIGSYVRGLLGGLAALQRAGVELPPLALYASRPGEAPDPLAAFGRPLIVSRLPGPVLTRLWDRAIVHAPRGFAVVHAPSLAAPPVRGALQVVTVHDVAWRHRPDDHPRRGREWHEAGLRRALERASHFVVPSEAVARDVVAAGAPERAVTLIPLGSDHLPPPDDGAATAVLDRLGVPGEFLLSVGTIEPRKNLGRLFEAYARARRSLPEPWPLVVVGPPGWGPEVEHGEGIVFAGPVDDAVLASLYRRARLLAYVPYEEGFGLPPGEAMHYGTPVVASAIPGAGDAALTVDPMDVADIAGALVAAATDDAVRARLAADGRARADRHTWEATARAHVALWGRLT